MLLIRNTTTATPGFGSTQSTVFLSKINQGDHLHHWFWLSRYDTHITNFFWKSCFRKHLQLFFSYINYQTEVLYPRFLCTSKLHCFSPHFELEGSTKQMSEVDQPNVRSDNFAIAWLSTYDEINLIIPGWLQWGTLTTMPIT